MGKGLELSVTELLKGRHTRGTNTGAVPCPEWMCNGRRPKYTVPYFIMSMYTLFTISPCPVHLHPISSPRALFRVVGSCKLNFKLNKTNFCRSSPFLRLRWTQLQDSGCSFRIPGHAPLCPRPYRPTRDDYRTGQQQ